MPIITEIRKYPRYKDYYKIKFDDGNTNLIDAETLVVFGLKENLNIDEETLDKILKKENINRTKSYALYLLSKKSYSSKSLQDKLITKGFEKENIQKIVERFQELGYLNDELYAKNLASYLQNKGKGPRFIENELKKHNINKEIISEILSSREEDIQDYERIIKIIKKKYPKFDGSDKSMETKAAMFLQRRGFSYSDISKALREMKNDNL